MMPKELKIVFLSRTMFHGLMFHVPFKKKHFFQFWRESTFNIECRKVAIFLSDFNDLILQHELIMELEVASISLFPSLEFSIIKFFETALKQEVVCPLVNSISFLALNTFFGVFHSWWALVLFCWVILTGLGRPTFKMKKKPGKK